MTRPSLDAWIREAKEAPGAQENGMYLFHNGVVRAAPKAVVRFGEERKTDVDGMLFSYDREKLVAGGLAVGAVIGAGIALGAQILNETGVMEKIVGGLSDALQSLVGEIKNECVIEKELY